MDHRFSQQTVVISWCLLQLGKTKQQQNKTKQTSAAFYSIMYHSKLHLHNNMTNVRTCLFRSGCRLHGQLFPSRLPALRGHTLSLVRRTLHTKSITKCNEKQNGTPANFENAPKFSCICLTVFPTVMKNKTECPTILKKMTSKWNKFYTHWDNFDPHRYHFDVLRRPFWPNWRPLSKK